MMDVRSPGLSEIESAIIAVMVVDSLERRKVVGDAYTGLVVAILCGWSIDLPAVTTFSPGKARSAIARHDGTTLTNCTTGAEG